MSDRGHIYRPKEHGGLTEHGQPDRRVKHVDEDASTHSASQREDAHRSKDHGRHHAQASKGTEDEQNYKPTEHGGVSSHGKPDHRVKEHESEGQAHKYRPTEHGGKTKSGEPDHRVGPHD
ncbi:hypothetical protein HDU85_006128 [Gaertneriomyces sp. JEL0708]|nr:hypothetical protein HDU85_006128 [Gaertneriomyces sp. JEL0708]